MDGEADRSPRPDWRDASSYAYTQELSPEGWAWEFLRRNSDYRAAWSRHLQHTNTEFAQRSQAREALSAAGTAEAAPWGLVAFRRSKPRSDSG
ncbi:MAG TPA: DUF6499 domain-containing protein [Stellaceae bacterium]|nr:DUF6499 domain-containing protein [Stellaceae bacterium]